MGWGNRHERIFEIDDREFDVSPPSARLALELREVPRMIYGPRENDPLGGGRDTVDAIGLQVLDNSVLETAIPFLFPKIAHGSGEGTPYDFFGFGSRREDEMEDDEVEERGASLTLAELAWAEGLAKLAGAEGLAELAWAEGLAELAWAEEVVE